MADLLPDAELEPVTSASPGEDTRILAALPVRLIPGEVPVAAADPASPRRTSLLIAWACVLLSAVAVAVLLSGTISLSERRAAFASAVTHEMRTPLTTFRMYTEMLVKGMVPDEAKRQRYLTTLSVEAQRLGHLVENVLAYARLERSRGDRHLEDQTLQELIDRAKKRLDDRARQAGMNLIIEAEPPVLETRVRVVATAVEQILFNLVDNACKYAASEADPNIHLEVAHSKNSAVLRVRDGGPGISKADARRLFRPFSKSAREAADSAPGVGLGLALSRRLARDMGGDLYFAQGATKGACFVLALPIG